MPISFCNASPSARAEGTATPEKNALKRIENRSVEGLDKELFPSSSCTTETDRFSYQSFNLSSSFPQVDGVNRDEMCMCLHELFEGLFLGASLPSSSLSLSG